MMDINDFSAKSNRAMVDRIVNKKVLKEDSKRRYTLEDVNVAYNKYLEVKNNKNSTEDAIKHAKSHMYYVSRCYKNYRESLGKNEETTVEKKIDQVLSEGIFTPETEVDNQPFEEEDSKTLKEEAVMNILEKEDTFDYCYGIPSQKKYPLYDEHHVRSAIKMFNHVEPRFERQLALAIIAKMRKYNIPFSMIGEKNRLISYLPKNAEVRLSEDQIPQIDDLTDKEYETLILEFVKEEITAYVELNEGLLTGAALAAAHVGGGLGLGLLGAGLVGLIKKHKKKKEEKAIANGSIKEEFSAEFISTMAYLEENYPLAHILSLSEHEFLSELARPEWSSLKKVAGDGKGNTFRLNKGSKDLEIVNPDEDDDIDEKKWNEILKEPCPRCGSKDTKVGKGGKIICKKCGEVKYEPEGTEKDYSEDNDDSAEVDDEEKEVDKEKDGKKSLTEAVTFIDNAGKLKTTSTPDYVKSMHEYDTKVQIPMYKRKREILYKLLSEELDSTLAEDLTINSYKISFKYNEKINTVEGTILAPTAHPNPDQLDDVIERANDAIKEYAKIHVKGKDNVKFNLDIKYPESLKEHVSGDMSVEDIAKKHDVSVEELEKQVKMGIEVEHEHTSDDEEAKRIALDHLYEFPDYYTRLDKMEEEGEAALKEEVEDLKTIVCRSVQDCLNVKPGSYFRYTRVSGAEFYKEKTPMSFNDVMIDPYYKKYLNPKDYIVLGRDDVGNSLVTDKKRIFYLEHEEGWDGDNEAFLEYNKKKNAQSAVVKEDIEHWEKMTKEKQDEYKKSGRMFYFGGKTHVFSPDGHPMLVGKDAEKTPLKEAILDENSRDRKVRKFAAYGASSNEALSRIKLIDATLQKMGPEKKNSKDYQDLLKIRKKLVKIYQGDSIKALKFLNKLRESEDVVDETESIEESVLDPVQKERCREIFDSEDRMLPEVKKQILDRFFEWKDGLEEEFTVDEVYLIGSSSGFQYTSTSDVDVTVISHDYSDDIWEKVKDTMPNGNNLEGTEHPVNYFIRTDMDERVAENIYDVQHDIWLKKSDKAIIDIHMPYIVEMSRFFMNAFDLTLKEYERDKMDYLQLKELDPEKVEISEDEKAKALDAKLTELKADLDAIRMGNHILRGFLHEAYEEDDGIFEIHIEIKAGDDPRWSPNNLVYKLLERYGYREKIDATIKEAEELIEAASQEKKEE